MAGSPLDALTCQMPPGLFHRKKEGEEEEEEEAEEADDAEIESG